MDTGCIPPTVNFFQYTSPPAPAAHPSLLQNEYLSNTPPRKKTIRTQSGVYMPLYVPIALGGKCCLRIRHRYRLCVEVF